MLGAMALSGCAQTVRLKVPEIEKSPILEKCDKPRLSEQKSPAADFIDLLVEMGVYSVDQAKALEDCDGKVRSLNTIIDEHNTQARKANKK